MGYEKKGYNHPDKCYNCRLIINNIYFLVHVVKCLERKKEDDVIQKLIDQLNNEIKRIKKEIQFDSVNIIPSLTSNYDTDILADAFDFLNSKKVATHEEPN